MQAYPCKGSVDFRAYSGQSGGDKEYKCKIPGLGVDKEESQEHLRNGPEGGRKQRTTPAEMAQGSQSCGT